MLRVADFYKVSLKQFMESIRDVKPSLNDSEILRYLSFDRREYQ